MVTKQEIVGEVAARQVVLQTLDAPLALAVAALDRVLPVADRLTHLLRRLAITGAASAAVVVLLLVRWRWSLSPAEGVALALVGGVLLVPPVILIAYRAALLRYAAAADRLRNAPDAVGERVDQMLRTVDEARAARRDGRWSTLGAIRQVAGVSRAFDATLDEFRPLATAADPLFVAAALGAVLLTGVEVGLALLLLLWFGLS